MINIVPYSDNYKKQIKKFVLSVLDEFGFTYDQNLDQDLEKPQEIYNEHLDGTMLLALEEEKVIGTIALHKIKDSIVELKRFYVEKKYRGQGVGRLLFSKAIHFAKKKKYKTIITDTTPNMERAVAFYKASGFRMVSYSEDRIDLELLLNQK